MQKILLSCVFCFLSIGCSTPSVDRSPAQGVREARLATEFSDEGIKIHYTILGKLEKVEVFGYADAWKGNVEVLAEADALAKLVKYVYGSDTSTRRRVSILGRAIEEAEEKTRSKSQPVEEVITSTDREIESRLIPAEKGVPASEAVRRRASLLNESIISTVTTIAAQGRLTGVRKTRDFTQNGGKTYVAVYQWSEKDQATVEGIRQRMNRNQ